MSDPIDMRFYCNLVSAEPVGPLASHTFNGQPRRTYTVAEAAKQCRWPESAMIALFNATYPPDGGRDDPRLSDLAEALYDDAVRKAAIHFYAECGSLPPATFLLALLIDWDMADPGNRRDTILSAISFRCSPAGTSFTRGGPGDHGQYAKGGGEHG